MNTLLSNRDLVFLFNLLLVLGGAAGLLWLCYRLVHQVSLQLKINRLFSFVLFGVTILFFRAQIAPFCEAIAAFIAYPYGVDEGENVLKHAMDAVKANRTTFKLGDIIVLCLSAFTLWSFAVWALARTITYTRQKLAENPKVDFFDQYITKAFLVSTLFVASLFLVISTIVAVPEFQSIETGIDVDKLEEEFKVELSRRTLSTTDLKVEENGLRINLDSLTRKGLAGTIPDAFNGAGRMRSLASDYNILVEWFLASREKHLLRLQNQYIAEVSQGMSERNRKFYRSQIFNEGMGHTQGIMMSLIAAKSRIESNNRDLRSSDKDRIIKLEKEVRKDLLNIRPLLIGGVPLSPYDAAKSLSIFGFTSRWLLQTRSLSLALIVGMFGFGLLGAISSSYIRVNIRRAGTPDKPEKKGRKVTTEDVLDDLDLRSLLITGITAAIIIFLSVKGALVVLTASESAANINPYVLFFICFAAALYNEEVWQWVLEKFRGYMRQEPSANAKAADDAPKPKPEPFKTMDVFTPSLTPDPETAGKLAQRHAEAVNGSDKAGTPEDAGTEGAPKGA